MTEPSRREAGHPACAAAPRRGAGARRKPGQSFHIFPFGCQMNRHDAESLASALRSLGLGPAGSPAEADVVLYMTCSVREHAEDRVWSHLGRWRRARERGAPRVLGVLGCMAERLGARVRSRMPHVDIVAGPGRLAEVPSLVAAALDGGGPVVVRGEPSGAADEAERCLPPAAGRGPEGVASPGQGPARPRPFQAYLAVMRGCSGRCAYCVVPGVRGPERSVPPGEVERSARRLLDAGAVEITLLGQNIDRYGLTLDPPTTFAALVGRLAPLPGLARLRFITSHPRDVTEELLRAMAEHANVMPYLHVPAQSGSDRALAAMRRGYTRAQYMRMLDRARAIVPGVGVASDFIVGFPGETDADFAETVSLVRAARFQSAFLFKYSPRPGTAAARLADDVPREVKEERHRLLSELQRETSLGLNRGLVGSEVEVLAEGESRRDPSRATGRTRSFRIAAFRARDEAAGRIVRVKVEDATALVLLGSEATEGEGLSGGGVGERLAEGER